MPYVCTFTSCPRPGHLYGSRGEWFEHELQLHRREWHCEACNLTFCHKEDIIEHIGGLHKEEFPESEYSAVAEWSERAQSSKQGCPLCPPNLYPTQEHLKQFHKNDINIAGTIDFSTEAERLIMINQDAPLCPYCPIKYEMTQLRRHLGHHLQQLALFILPRPAEDKVFTGKDGEESEVAYRGDSESDSQSEVSSNIEIVAEESGTLYKRRQILTDTGPNTNSETACQKGVRALRVNDCVIHMVRFVQRNGLAGILGLGLTDEELRMSLRPQARIAARLPLRSPFFDRYLCMSLTLLGLYDLAILIGNCLF